MERHMIVTVRKFKNEKAHKLNKPYEVLTSEHSDLLDEGADELIKLLIGTDVGGAPTDFGETAYMGVGISSVEFDPTHTDLQGGTKTYKQVDAQPTKEVGQKAQWVATFQSAEGNHVWEEYTVSNTADGTGKNLMRILASKGTKAVGEVWELTIQEEFA